MLFFYTQLLEPPEEEWDGKYGAVLEISERMGLPQAVNLVVGGTAEAPRLWHEVPLDDLSDLLPDYVAGEQVVPLLVSRHAEVADCYSVYAAQQGIAQKLMVRGHQYMLAFVCARGHTVRCRHCIHM